MRMLINWREKKEITISNTSIQISGSEYETEIHTLLFFCSKIEATECKDELK